MVYGPVWLELFSNVVFGWNAFQMLCLVGTFFKEFRMFLEMFCCEDTLVGPRGKAHEA